MTRVRLTEDLQPEPHSAGSGLRCQWCSVALPAGETVCPTCNSPGVPDPNLTAPGIEILEPATSAEPVKLPEELDEWWLEDEAAGRPVPKAQSSVAVDEDRLIKTVAILIGTAVACAFVGWLAGPPLLAPVMENITGSPVEDMNDLRPMGSIFGFVSGIFLGACIGWAAQA